MDKRKAIIVIAVVIAVVLVALAVFYFFFRRESPVTPPDSVLPIGEDLPGGTGTTAPSVSETYENQPKTFEQKLRLISSLPVSGATLFDKNAETFVRYIERAKGNVFEAVASKNTAPYRISNTTIPKIYEAYWTQNGEGVVLRFLKDGTDEVQTYYASLKSSSTSTEQSLSDGTFLSNNITTLTTSPARDRIFYLANTPSETVGIRANPNGTARSQLFSSPAQEWLITWPRVSTIVVSTKPSATVPGLLYFLDTGTGSLRKILSGINGMTALANSDATTVLFSESKQSRVSLKLLSVVDQRISEVGIGTLPEKCVWSKREKDVVFCAVPDNIPSSDYPDAWYQGKVSFVDNIWRVNTKTGEAKVVLSPQTVAKTVMDITDLVLSENEKYLLFTNKKDLSLWLLTLDTPASQ